MSSVEIVPFSEDHIEAAASLVAARYRTERELNKSLPARYEKPDAILERLRPFANGRADIAVMCQGQLKGFLLGLIFPLRGVRTAWSPDWGHAVNPVRDYETYREMYTALAPRWVANGCFDHAVTVLAHERAVSDAWFSLGFGMAGIDALRDLSPVKGAPSKVEIRRATLEDIDVVLRLTVGLQRHLATSPIFMPLMTYRERRFHEEWLSNRDKVLWLASLSREIVGHMRLGPVDAPYAPMPVSDKETVAISGAFAWEDHRSRGIGTALLDHSLQWARSAGYKNCSVDFESANILGSRFWHRSGFRPVCYSLVRRIDERIAWAHENRDEIDLLRGL
ncbi:MAG: GNAT family N-acetyltransferase [Dehalococcoidales bacterium]|nr:MAG: GNAT family N-acetyltransferase [Dehalococcoidales bacterium]